jgi:CPA2 family monovalent cation:H+ antiporter-2
MILGETPLSRRATEETLPLRDAFAVLFFVSVGMLFDPAVVVEHPLPLLATVGIIILGKSIAAFIIVRAFGYSGRKALTIAASLAQIGEFSFILAALGAQLGILPPEGRDLILGGAIISIFLNPFIFSLIVARAEEAAADEKQPQQPATRGHIILVGYGRVGQLIARELKSRRRPFIVIEDQPDTARQAEADGMEMLNGDALDRRTLEAAGIAQSGKLLIAIPEGFEAGAIAAHARELNPEIRVIARAHSDAEVEHLKQLGVSEVVMGEREIAARMSSLVSQ